MILLNLTQHVASAEQVNDGVIDLPEREQQEVSRLLTFETPPSQEEMEARAYALTAIAHRRGASAVMIGGAPFFMSSLETALRAEGLRVLYAFSRRESVETPDGKKTSVFRHAGWVEAE